ncbi:unnamed protein product [Symbiodinium sp. CCMP2456]|nr:unnamed protein product [Symbiodinium sp. CCMP2456]
MSAASTAERVSLLTSCGEWDLALGVIPTASIKSAPLYLLEAQAFHARAFVGNDRDGDTHRACEGAQHAINQLRQLNMASADEALLAQALLLKANTLANLAASEVLEFKQSLNEATSAVREAERVLCAFNLPDVANAYRIMGVIRQTRHQLRQEDTASLRKAQLYFLAAIREYEKHGVEASSEWYAVSHWNMYIILRRLDKAKKAVSFLKRAADLRAYSQGSKHPYTRRYQRLLQEEKGRLRRLQVCMGDAEMQQEVDSSLDEHDTYDTFSSGVQSLFRKEAAIR